MTVLCEEDFTSQPFKKNQKELFEGRYRVLLRLRHILHLIAFRLPRPTPTAFKDRQMAVNFPS